MRNTVDLDNRLIYRAIDELSARLPADWRTEVEFEPTRSDRVLDAFLKLCAPDGTCGTLILEAKNRLEPRDVSKIADQLAGYGRLSDGEVAVPVLVAPFLSSRTRERLEERAVGYIDLTGNVRVALDRPALFVHTTGPSGTPGARSGLRERSRERRRAGSYAPFATMYRPPASGSSRKRPGPIRGTSQGSLPCSRRKL